MIKIYNRMKNQSPNGGAGLGVFVGILLTAFGFAYLVHSYESWEVIFSIVSISWGVYLVNHNTRIFTRKKK